MAHSLASSLSTDSEAPISLLHDALNERSGLEGNMRSSEVLFDASLVQVPQRNIVKEGWLKKKGNASSFWRNRYFVLSDDLLHYYRHPSDTLPRNSIKIQGYALIYPINYAQFKKDFVFQLKTRHSGKVYYLRALSEADRDDWIGKIRSCVLASRKISNDYMGSKNETPFSLSVGDLPIEESKHDYLNSNVTRDEHSKTETVAGPKICRKPSKGTEMVNVLDRMPPVFSVYQKFAIYETKSRFYILGSDEERTRFQFLKIPRVDCNNLTVDLDETIYTKVQANVVLDMVRGANENSGGVKRICVAFAIVGFIRLLQGYQMIVVKERRKVGEIGGHIVYAIEETLQIQVTNPDYLDESLLSKDIVTCESKYKQKLALVDLTKNFYFSYTLDLSKTVQTLMRTPYENNFDPRDSFIWNWFLLKDLKAALGIDPKILLDENDPRCMTMRTSWQWIVHFIHGYFEQSRCSILGRVIDLYLISRRSRFFAGTRYLKRGINEEGHSANDVETEQVIFDRIGGSFLEGQYTSYVQIRASIPLHWTQESNAMVARPPIVMQKFDPVARATRKHFEDLFRRYGSPCLVLNLVKQNEYRPRESLVGKPFGDLVEYLNEFLPTQHKIDYLAWDFKKFCKSKLHSVVDELMILAEWAVQRTGIYHSVPRSGSNPPDSWQTTSIRPDKGSITNYLEKKGASAWKIGHSQKGIIRSNCIDSLDRTNVAQFCIGKRAAGYQLHALGLLSSSMLDCDSPFVKLLLEMYERMGDCLAMQYGGSQMHRQMSKDRRMTTMAPVLYRNGAPAKPKEMLVSLMRHYQNSFQDSDKQEAMNLFLGAYSPTESNDRQTHVITSSLQKTRTSAHLWELESDYFLHNSIVDTASFCGDLDAELLVTNWWRKPLEHYEKSIKKDPHLIQKLKCSNFEQTYQTTKLTFFDEIMDESKSPIHPKETLISRESTLGANLNRTSFGEQLLNSPISTLKSPGDTRTVPGISRTVSFAEPLQPRQGPSVAGRVVNAIRRLTTIRRQNLALKSDPSAPVIGGDIKNFKRHFYHLFDSRLSPYLNIHDEMDFNPLNTALERVKLSEAGNYDPYVFCLAVPTSLVFSSIDKPSLEIINEYLKFDDADNCSPDQDYVFEISDIDLKDRSVEFEMNSTQETKSALSQYLESVTSSDVCSEFSLFPNMDSFSQALWTQDLLTSQNCMA